eukprot:168880-Amphidinium_carterae.1
MVWKLETEERKENESHSQKGGFRGLSRQHLFLICWSLLGEVGKEVVIEFYDIRGAQRFLSASGGKPAQTCHVNLRGTVFGGLWAERYI